jgi:WD40 repeat protein
MSRCYPGRFIAISLALVVVISVRADQPAGNAPVRTDRFGDPLPNGATKRFGTVRWLATGRHLSFSPDGQTILICNRFEVSTIDANTGKQLRRTRLQRPEKPSPRNNIDVAFSRDCKTIAAVESGPQKVRFWEVASGKLLREFTAYAGHFPSLAWSPDGRWVAVSGTHFYLLDAATGAPHKLSEADLGQGNHSLWSDLSPDSKYLATAVEDRFIRVWDLSTCAMVDEFRVRPGSMGFTPDGKQVACLVADRHEIKFWNAGTGKEGASIQLIGEEPIDEFEISSDCKLLAAKSRNRIFLWSLPERKLLRSLVAPEPRWFGFSPDGKKLASSDDGAISMWDVATGQELNPRPGHVSDVNHLAFSPDGKILASTERGRLILWGVAAMTPLRSLSFPALCGPPRFSADGRLLMTGDALHGIRLWDVATGKSLGLLAEASWKELRHWRHIDYRLSPDRKRVGALKDGRDGQISRLWLWDRTTGKVVVRPAPATCHDACLSHDCRLVALYVWGTRAETGSKSWLYIQDVLTGRNHIKTSTEAIFAMAFSADGKTLASIRERRVALAKAAASKSSERRGDVEEICVWEVATGKERLRFAAAGFHIFAWSPNVRLLATLDWEQAHIWDGITGKELLRIPLPDTAYECLAFSPDSRTLAIGMPDTTILTWDLSPQLALAGFPAKSPGQKDLERLWAELAGPDAGRAHQAIWTLVAASGEAVPFLKAHIRPIAEEDLKLIDRSIADLDSPQFGVRSAAEKSLRRLFLDAEPALREALQKKPSLEARQRLESILATPFDEPSEALAQLRALEALEYIGNPEAKQLIEKLATGAPRARLTQEAKASLERLANRPTTSP